MAFKKGVSGNPKGKPIGTKCKATGKTREVFQMIVEGYHDKIIDDLDALEPKDRLKVILEMSQYFLPKMQATTIDANVKAEVEERNNIIVKMQQMYGFSREAEAVHGAAEDEYETFDPFAEEEEKPDVDKEGASVGRLFGDGKGGGYAIANSDSTFFGKKATDKKKKTIASKNSKKGTKQKV